VSLGIKTEEKSERSRLAECLQLVAKQKSRPAFAELFEYFAPRLKGYLVRLGSNETAAEEVMQDVMLTVWRKAEQFDPRKASASTWIFRIARNRRIDLHRRRSKPDLDPEEPLLQPAATEPPDITVNRLQMESIVRRELETLPEEQIVVLRAAFYDGLSHGEIADHLKLPLGTVKSRIRLAFRKLRGQLDEPL